MSYSWARYGYFYLSDDYGPYWIQMQICLVGNCDRRGTTHRDGEREGGVLLYRCLEHAEEADKI